MTIDSFFYIGQVYIKNTEKSRSDELRAYKWFQLSSEYGSALAYYDIGKLFFSKVIYNLCHYHEALKWFEKAVEAGNKLACFYLGILHGRGLGTHIDKEKADSYLKHGLENGDSRCLYILSARYVVNGQLQ